MNAERIEIARRSGHLFAQNVHPYLPASKCKHLIKKLRPPNARMIDFNPAFGDSDDIQKIVDYLTANGIPEEDISIIYAGQNPAKIIEKYLNKPISELGISLGSDVAERDEGLTKYFIETSSFKRVDNNMHHIVVGPKGMGKTAILRYMMSNNDESIIVTPEYYATDLLGSIEKEGLSNEVSVYISTWKYSLIVELMQRLVRNRKHSPSIKALRNYLKENSLTSDFEESIFEKFMSYLRRFTKISGGVAGHEISLELDSPQSAGAQGLFRLTEVLDLMPEIRKSVKGNPIYIYIDELDQSWDNSKTANNFLIALFTAALQLRSYDENIQVFVFLRSEIFQLLKPEMPQLDKFRSDIIELFWSERDLRSLIESRLVSSLSIVESLPFATLTNSLFINDENWFSGNAFDYLVSRTTYRPREVIQICSLAIEWAARAGKSRVNSAAIRAAEEQFSDWKFEHLLSETIYIYPNLGDLLDVLREGPALRDRQELSSQLVDFLLGAQDHPSCPEWISEIKDESGLIEILYSCDVLGVLRFDAASEQASFDLTDFDFHYRRPSARLGSCDRFLIHPCLWRSLQIMGG